MAEHIHTVDDGRGYRKVFVNGNYIPETTYADTKKGVVYFAPSPVRVMRRKQEIYQRKLTGTVTVEFIN